MNVWRRIVGADERSLTVDPSATPTPPTRNLGAPTIGAMRSFVRGAMAAGAVTLALPVSVAGAMPAELGPNRITNPGADDGACGEGLGGVPIPGWTVGGDTAVICWSTGGGYPEPTDPGPADRGTAFFGGGYGATSR